MKKIFSVFVFVIVAVDVLGFMAWVASGQIPSDGFYIGRITAEVLYLIK